MPHFDTQEETAAWMGIDVETMNREHDILHEELACFYGVKSHSLAARDGEPYDETKAWKEEDAVLHVQRWLYSLDKGDY